MFPLLVLVGNKLLAGGLILLAMAVLVWRRPRGWRSAWPFAAVLGLMAAWGAASAIWSIMPGMSLERAARFAGLALCGVVVCIGVTDRRRGDRTAVAVGLLAGLAAAAGLAVAGLAWHALAGRSMLDALNYKPFATVTAILLFPAAGMLGVWGCGRWAIAAGGALSALFVWSDSLAGLVATIVGAAVYAFVHFGRRRAAAAVSIVLGLSVVAMPTFVAWSDSPARISEWGVRLRHSMAHRVAVWDFVGQRILERPALGWGLGMARNIPGAEVNPLDRPRYRDMLLSSGISPKTELRSVPMHPHNAVLHMWLELGVVGVLLYLVLGALCLRGIMRCAAERNALSAAMATIAAAVVVGQVSFSVWQSWWIAAQFLVAAILLAVYRFET